jgi:hypothetical protein
MQMAAIIIIRHSTDSFVDRIFILTSTKASFSFLDRQNLI